MQSEPYSRSDLWAFYHQDHQDKSHSSLIHIAKLNGGLTIIGTLFQNIIGTSGSVLRILDSDVGVQSVITIALSYFNGNYAYDGFANVLIVKKGSSTFNQLLECPKITIQGSYFTSSSGCPGAYGNVFLLCYLDASPRTLEKLSDYTLGSDAAEFRTILTSMDSSLAIITVKDSLFQNNVLSVSNSLSIVGSMFTYLENNQFVFNGGTMDNLYLGAYMGSYYPIRHPTRVYDASNTIHFGQSTSVLFDYVYKIHTSSNTFAYNWGPFQGSFALASCITIKNTLLMKKCKT